MWSRASRVVAIGLLLAACGGSGRSDDAASSGDSGADSGTLDFVVVTHGQSADPFWSVVSLGVRDAGRDLGVQVRYQAPGRFSLVEMANMIEAAVASRPDGIAVSLPDADALSGVVRHALEQGVPVVSLNAGSAVFDDLGIGAHVGQPEYEAGRAAGSRMAEAGVRSGLCVNHEVGNLSLDRRCEGFSDALIEAGGTGRVLAAELANPADTRERIAGALSRDASLDGLLTLGAAAVSPALSALAEVGRDVPFATFDLSTEVLDAIEDGGMLFAVDQQPYLQGYLPVVVLASMARTGMMPVGVVRTGPHLVAAADVGGIRGVPQRGLAR
ncbi:MAG: sugar ABC transporter substrate-binding protein [Longimicrobiales bacterium]|nr:sugar ABC transporter substrate-binding protein [Longimicrobiales bacterium]